MKWRGEAAGAGGMQGPAGDRLTLNLVDNEDQNVKIS
jgi:hypothetical protein